MRLVSCPACRTQYDGATTSAASFTCACGETVRNVEPIPVDALIHRCGSCGASVASDAVRCDYCRGAIVRDRRQMGLICPECFARNPTRSRYCTSCGVEFAPHPVVGPDLALTCPADGETRLTSRAIGGTLVHECPNCAGLWIPSEVFDRLVAKATSAHTERASLGLGTASGPQRRWTGGGAVRYRKCPICAGIMNRKNFGARSGILVDWCGAHGTWLDADELEEIAAFILEGGLAASTKSGEEESGRGSADRFRAIAESERILAEARASRDGGRGFATRSLGELIAALLDR